MRIKEHSLGLQFVAKLRIDRAFDPQHHLTNLVCAIDIQTWVNASLNEQKNMDINFILHHAYENNKVM